MDEACRICGFLRSEHKIWEGTPPNYRSAIVCPDGQNTFLGLDETAEWRLKDILK